MAKKNRQVIMFFLCKPHIFAQVFLIRVPTSYIHCIILPSFYMQSTKIDFRDRFIIGYSGELRHGSKPFRQMRFCSFIKPL